MVVAILLLIGIVFAAYLLFESKFSLRILDDSALLLEFLKALRPDSLPNGTHPDCPIFLERFSNSGAQQPLCLPCSHCYCHHCTTRYFRRDRLTHDFDDYDKEFRCPFCRLEIPMTEPEKLLSYDISKSGLRLCLYFSQGDWKSSPCIFHFICTVIVELVCLVLTWKTAPLFDRIVRMDKECLRKIWACLLCTITFCAVSNGVVQLSRPWRVKMEWEVKRRRFVG
jgi:hypothetical protein